MPKSAWYDLDARERAQQAAGEDTPLATPVQAAYFHLWSTSLKAALPDNPKLSDLLAVLNYEDNYTTPDDYWGQDVSVAQVPLAVPAYGTGVDGNGYGPLFPAGPDLYYIEFRFQAALAGTAIPAIRELSVSGNINGNVEGWSVVNDGDTVLQASLTEIFSVLADGGDALGPVQGDSVNVLTVTGDQTQGWVTIIKLPTGSGPQGIQGEAGPATAPTPLSWRNSLTLDAITPGDFANQPWITDAAPGTGDDFLDFTDPTQPAAKYDGVLSISAILTVATAQLEDGKALWFEIDLGHNAEAGLWSSYPLDTTMETFGGAVYGLSASSKVAVGDRSDIEVAHTKSASIASGTVLQIFATFQPTT